MHRNGHEPNRLQWKSRAGREHGLQRKTGAARPQATGRQTQATEGTNGWRGRVGQTAEGTVGNCATERPQPGRNAGRSGPTSEWQYRSNGRCEGNRNEADNSSGQRRKSGRSDAAEKLATWKRRGVLVTMLSSTPYALSSSSSLNHRCHHRHSHCPRHHYLPRCSGSL